MSNNNLLRIAQLGCQQENSPRVCQVWRATSLFLTKYIKRILISTNTRINVRKFHVIAYF